MQLNDTKLPFTSLAAIEKALQAYWPVHVKRSGRTTEHMAALMRVMGDPQNTFRSIHIAGTSGKTSTAYYTAALLTQAKKKTGLLISPHLEKLNERVQIQGEPLAEPIFCSEFSQYFKLVVRSKLPVVFTEVLYGFAFWEFARQQVDVGVIETGVGGLLDATNVMDRDDKTCIITDIGYDHTNILGATLPEIATHKAGIIGFHSTVFCYQQAPEILDVIQKACYERKATLCIVANMESVSVASAELPLFQQRNFGLALAAASYFLQANSFEPLSQLDIASATNTYIPARMERHVVRDKTLIFDAAHNTQKLQALAKSMEAAYRHKKVAILVVFTAGRGRDIQAQLSSLLPICSSLIVTALPVDPISWHSPEDVAVAAERAGLPRVRIVSDYREAFEELMRQPEAILLVTGSLYAQQYFKQLLATYS